MEEVKLRTFGVPKANAPEVPVAPVKFTEAGEVPTRLDEEVRFTAPPVEEYVEETPLCIVELPGKIHSLLKFPPACFHFQEIMFPGVCGRKVLAKLNVGNSAVVAVSVEICNLARLGFKDPVVPVASDKN